MKGFEGGVTAGEGSITVEEIKEGAEEGAGSVGEVWRLRLGGWTGGAETDLCEIVSIFIFTFFGQRR